MKKVIFGLVVIFAVAVLWAAQFPSSPSLGAWVKGLKVGLTGLAIDSIAVSEGDLYVFSGEDSYVFGTPGVTIDTVRNVAAAGSASSGITAIAAGGGDTLLVTVGGVKYWLRPRP